MRGNKVLRKTVISALLLLTTVLVIPPPQAFSASLSAAEQLTDSSNIVTSGDGLYVDTYETGRYVYRGADPNNHILFNGESWRIIAVERDSALKIMRVNRLSSMIHDQGYSASDGLAGTRWSDVNTDYCYYSDDTTVYYGCNVWGSVDTMLDSTGKNKITTMPKISGGVEYDLPNTEATANKYMNSTFYNSLNEDKRLVEPHLFRVGPVTYSATQTLQQDIQQEEAYTWKGNIGMINITDYVKASLDARCTSVYVSNNSTEYVCLDNYIVNSVYNVRTITPSARASQVSSRWLYAIYTTGNAYHGFNASSSHGVNPTLYLTPQLRIESGTGTSVDPYVVRSIGETDIKVSINSALALSLDSNDLVLEPIPNGEVAKEDVVVSVSTNDVVGYKLIMNVVENGGTSLNYINTNDNFSIPSTTSTGELVANAWGYGLGEASATTTFKPIPAFSSPDTLKTKTGLSLNDTTAITFGVRVNMDVPAGSYQNTVAFTVIANV